MTRRLSAGEEALHEAARLEAAKVYGTVCREHKQPVPVPAPVAAALTARELSAKPAQHYDVSILAAIRDGLTNSQIIDRLHVTYAQVRAHRMHTMRGVAS